MTAVARTSKRAQFTEAVRIQLLEDDADESDHQMERLNERVSRLLVISAGILVSTTTGTIMLALNLLVK